MCFWARATAAATIFKIGAPDGDYQEFAIAGKHADYAGQFSNDVNFVVGQSDPSRDWPYILPGPADAWAGRKAHIFKINFQIPELRSNNYCCLIIEFVSTHYSDPPRLVIDINGEKIEHVLPAGRNDNALATPKAGENYSLQQLFPSALLHADDNTISLTSASGSWALFDDVRLESGVAAPAETLDVKIEPLPFFRRVSDALQRAVNVSIDDLEGSGPAELSWTSKAGSGSQKFDLHFGKNDFQILAPDTNQIEFALRTRQREIKTSVTLPPEKNGSCSSCRPHTRTSATLICRSGSGSVTPTTE